MISKFIFIFLLNILYINLVNAKSENECTNFRLGNSTNIKTNHGDWIAGATYSPDGKKIVTASLDGSSKVFDAKTGKKLFEIHHGDSVIRASFSPDGKKIVTTSSRDHNNKVTDAETGKVLFTIKHENDCYVMNALFSPNGEKIVTYCIGGSGKVFNSRSGKKLFDINHFSQITSATFSSDGKKILTSSLDATIRVTDAESGALIFQIAHKNEEWIHSAMFSHDGSKILTVSKSGNQIVKVFDTETKKELFSIKHDGWVEAEFSLDGEKIVISNDDIRKIHNAKTGKQLFKIKYNSSGDATLLSDGKTLVTNSDANVITVLDTESGEEISNYNAHATGLFGQKFTTNNSNLLVPSGKKLINYTLESVCVKNNNFKEEKNCSDKTDATGNAKDLNNIVNQNFLCSIAKPGNFKPKENLEKLIAILKSKLTQLNPVVIKQVLANILLTDNLLYEDLLRKVPELLNFVSNTDSKNRDEVCSLSEKEKKIINNGVLQYANALVDIAATFDDFYTNLYPLRDIIATFDKQTKEDLWHAISQKLAERAADSIEYSGIFVSKLYKLSKNAVAPIFNEKPKLVTDLSIIREKNTIRPVMLSTKAFQLETNDPVLFGLIDRNKKVKLNNYGFYDFQTKPIEIKGNLVPGDVVYDKNLSWKAGEKNFNAKLKITASEKAGFVKNEKGPDYEKMWKGGFNGMVILGTNLKDSAFVMDEYLSYYQEKNFNCSNKKLINNLKKFMQDEISSGKTDYLIKEAHSDGDDRNIFRIDKKALVVDCKNPSKKESVKLVFPVGASNESGNELLSNQDFGNWIKEREKKGEGPLLYLNTSCWSAKNKAVNELEASQSPLLINIPSVTMATTFTNEKTDVEQLMLTGFRNKKSYAEIREELSKNEDYRNKKQNYFIFPDDQDYDQYIHQVLKKPIKTEIEITDNEGKIYNIDEAR